VKFSWFGGLLLKVHCKLLQDCKAYHRAVEKGNKYVWSKDCDEAYQTLNKLLTALLVQAQPNIPKPFDVYYDASGTDLGCVLMQEW
jgi:hypothetical protein